MESVPYIDFIFGLTNRQPRLVSKSSMSRANGLVALDNAYGARVMLSTPPAMNTSPSPVLIARAAFAIAAMPDAQSRLTVSPGTLTGNPASSAAIRATFRLSSPA